MFPVGPPNELDINLMVSDLLCPISNSWDVSKIRRYLPQYEALILRLITSSAPAPDGLVWLPEKTGIYSTKTGYGVGMSSHFGAGLISTPFDWNKSIWNVKTAPKIRDFLWRTVRKAIPVSSNLATRGIQEFPCKRCNGVEDDLHLFLQCDIAREVWELAPLAVKPSSATPSMATLISAASSFIVLPPVGLTIPLWPWILWHLWKARNKLSFENRAFSSMEIILKAITDAREWQSAQCTDQIGSIVAARSSTLPPPYMSPTHRMILLYAMLMQHGIQ